MTQLSGHDAAPRFNGQFCAMLGVDIVGSTRADRDEEIQLYQRSALYGLVREGLDRSGMPWDQCQYEDRGDGAVLIFPPELPAQPIVDSFPERLRSLIRRHNRCACDSAHMQLRVAAHVGPVYCDEHGFAGDDVTLLCRMLDAQPLRQALSESGCELALIISGDIYDKLVRRRHSLTGPKSFRPVKAQVKGTRIHAWMYLPDGPPP